MMLLGAYLYYSYRKRQAVRVVQPSWAKQPQNTLPKIIHQYENYPVTHNDSYQLVDRRNVQQVRYAQKHYPGGVATAVQKAGEEDRDVMYRLLVLFREGGVFPASNIRVLKELPLTKSDGLVVCQDNHGVYDTCIFASPKHHPATWSLIASFAKCQLAGGSQSCKAQLHQALLRYIKTEGAQRPFRTIDRFFKGAVKRQMVISPKLFKQAELRNSMTPMLNFDNTEPIPKYVYRIFPKDWTKKLQKVFKKTKLNTPGFTHVYYDDDAIQEFIETTYKDYPRIIDAYNNINPNFGASRADLARYLLIYAKGGVYLDAKSVFVKQITLDGGSMYVSHWDFKPHYQVFPPSGEYQNWWLVAKKGHPIMWHVINQVVHNIEAISEGILLEDEFYSSTRWCETKKKCNVLAITGPLMFTYAIKNYIDNNGSNDIVVTPPNFDNSVKYSGVFHKKLYKHSKTTHYSLVNESLINLNYRTTATGVS